MANYRKIAASLSIVTALGLLFGGCHADPSTPQSSPTPLTTFSALTQTKDLLPASIGSLPALDTSAIADKQVLISPGWSLDAWASVPGASRIAWTGEGDMLVTSSSTGAIYRLHEGEAKNELPTRSLLINGLDHPYDIAVVKFEGETLLIVSVADGIVSFKFSAGVAEEPRKLVQYSPEDIQGSRIIFSISPDNTYLVYASSAIPDSNSQERQTRGHIRAVDLDGTNDRFIAAGVRSSGGLDFSPTGEIYTAVSSVTDPAYPYHQPIDGLSDGFGAKGTSWAQSQPADFITKVGLYDDLGWPFCLPVSQPTAEFVPDAIANPANSQFDCTSLNPNVTFLPAHSSPVSFNFLFDSSLPSSLVSGGLAVTYGPSNAKTNIAATNPQSQSSLYYVPSETSSTTASLEAETTTLGQPSVLLTGFVNPDSTSWARLGDASPSPTGKIYLTDPQNGFIYQLTPIAS